MRGKKKNKWEGDKRSSPHEDNELSWKIDKIRIREGSVF